MGTVHARSSWSPDAEALVLFYLGFSVVGICLSIFDGSEGAVSKADRSVCGLLLQ